MPLIKQNFTNSSFQPLFHFLFLVASLWTCIHAFCHHFSLSLSVNLCLSVCWPKTYRLPIISPTKKKKKKGERNERKKGWQGDLIGISRELESRVCSHSEPLTSEEELFTGVGKEDAWAAVSNVTMAFHRLIVVRKGAFIPCWAVIFEGCESSQFWSPNLM